jgi:succinyl-CoA synthetase alpha subunit
MSILVNKDTRVVFQGITGESGSLHARACLQYGTKIVAGVTPGRGGQKFEDKVPIFDTVADAVQKEGADTACIFVPPAGAADAIVEAADAGCRLVVAITEGIPVLDMVRVRRSLEGKPVRSPTRPSGSSARSASASRRAWASAATRSRASISSTSSTCSTRTRTRTASS